jgi:hypothetical protein
MISIKVITIIYMSKPKKYQTHEQKAGSLGHRSIEPNKRAFALQSGNHAKLDYSRLASQFQIHGFSMTEPIPEAAME